MGTVALLFVVIVNCKARRMRDSLVGVGGNNQREIRIRSQMTAGEREVKVRSVSTGALRSPNAR